MDSDQFVMVPLQLWEERSKSIGQKEIPQNTFRNNQSDLSKETIVSKENSKRQEREQDDRIMTHFVGDSTKRKRSTTILKFMRNHPLIKFSNDDTILIDDGDTGIPVEKFINDLHRKSTAIPDQYLNILSLLKLPRNIVENSNALSKDRGDWISL